MYKTCKQCLQEKSLKDFYSHPKTKDGTVNRCKECIKLGRKTEKERKMARINDLKRTKNPERIQYMKTISKRFRTENP